MPIINNIMIFVHGFAHKKLKKYIQTILVQRLLMTQEMWLYIHADLEPINLTKCVKYLVIRMMLLALMISLALSNFDKSGLMEMSLKLRKKTRMIT